VDGGVFVFGESPSSAEDGDGGGEHVGDVIPVPLDEKEEHLSRVLEAFDDVDENDDADEYDEDEVEVNDECVENDDDDGVGFKPNGSGFELPAPARTGVEGAVGAKGCFVGDGGLRDTFDVGVDGDVSSKR
jgi:hypothetical protein